MHKDTPAITVPAYLHMIYLRLRHPMCLCLFKTWQCVRQGTPWYFDQVERPERGFLVDSVVVSCGCNVDGVGDGNDVCGCLNDERGALASDGDS